MTDSDLIASVRALPHGPAAITALTLYGEARGSGDAELRGIAAAIRNRLVAQRPAWGLTADAVCLHPWAFSCWRVEGGAHNYEAVIYAAKQYLRPTPQFGPALRRCQALADQIVAGALPDTVKGSTHYLTLKLWQQAPPTWAAGRQPTVIIGSTVFFAGIV